MFYSSVDVEVRPHLSALTTSVRPLSHISIHSYTLHRGKLLSIHDSQLSMNLCPFRSSDTKKHTTACPWCKPLMEQSICITLRTNEQLNHTCSSSTSDLELQHDQASSVPPVAQRKHSHVAQYFKHNILIKAHEIFHLSRRIKQI